MSLHDNTKRRNKFKIISLNLFHKYMRYMKYADVTNMFFLVVVHVKIGT